MNHRIRNCFGITEPTDDSEKMGGEGVIVEADTTIVGGKVKNMNNQRRKEITEKKRGSFDNKTHVSGIVERSGKIRLEVIKAGNTDVKMMKRYVDKDSVVMTDNAHGFKALRNHFASHGIIDHQKSQYCIDGVTHTNTIEGAFSLLDRMVTGIYHYISPKHMQKYLNEFSFRYNSRTSSECNRFALMLSNTENRLTYKSLIAE